MYDPPLCCEWVTRSIINPPFFCLLSSTNQINLQEFFTSTLSAVQSVTLAYNEKGKSTGQATVLFKNAPAAKAAVNKYNNAPIDNGRSRLTLELVVDPTKKPLAARIQPNKALKSVPLKTKLLQKKNARQAAVRGVKNAPKPAGKPKSAKPKKKSLAELDAEMADYFAKNEAN